MGTKLPTPKAACCYYQSLSVTQTDNFTNDIEDCENVELGEDSDGGPVLEAIYDLAPDADYYIATISHPTFYHNDLNGIVDWIAVEGVDLILFRMLEDGPVPAMAHPYTPLANSQSLTEWWTKTLPGLALQGIALTAPGSDSSKMTTTMVFMSSRHA